MDLTMMPIAMRFKKIYRLGAVSIAILILVACGGGGGGSGGNNTATPAPPTNTNTNSSFIYNGPAPSSTEVQRFQQSFYNNLVNDNRCGSCHSRGGAGASAFVDRTDINFAYSQALPLVNFESPAASKIVEKVYNDGKGHNCWEASAAACRVQMISFIEAWMSNGGTVSTSVKLTAPKDRNPNGAGNGFKSFPATASAAGFIGGPATDSVYDLVTRFCSGCHSETSTVKQQPYFASPDPLVAYEAIKSKIDLNDPALLPGSTLKAKSRLVVRLRDEFHNCWTASCENDANKMQAAIRALADPIQAIVLDPNIYRSQAQVLNDGVVGVSGGRFELYQIALWRFLEGEGKVISDTSGVSPGISLTIQGDEGDTGTFKWVGGGGIQFLTRPTNGVGAVASDTVGNSSKLYDLISASGEYTVEAWTTPANITDMNKDIVAYGNGSDRRNFMLGQTMYNYDFYNRSSDTNSLGMVDGDKFSSAPAKKALQANSQHVVVTYDAVNGRKVFVDGELVSNPYPDDRGTLAADWDKGYRILLGDTLTRLSPWQGILRMVAIHKRALNPEQITKNFGVPPGERRYVMFNVSKIQNMPASCYNSATDTSYCYIYFEVSQYDNYAYLFNRPHFISLNSDVSDIHNLTIKGIRIGINGKLSSVGQAYVHVDTVVDSSSPQYVPGNEPGSGQALQPPSDIILNPDHPQVGTVIPKLSGADVDLLYLEFDQIRSNISPTPTVIPASFAYVLSGNSAIDLGWRTFDEINATFSQMTTITDPNAMTGGATPVKVGDVFNSLRSQLPAVEDFPAYLASHQTSVTKLAIAYCSALMNDNTKRNTFFTTTTPSQLTGNGWDNLVNPLVSKFTINSALYNAPSNTPPSISISTPMHNELIQLLTHVDNPMDNPRRNAGLCVGGSCSTDSAILNAATVTCAAALANAAMTMQ